MSVLSVDLPRPLQPQLILVLPGIVDVYEHTTVAGMLLAHLADAHQEGPRIESELRLPVLSALGRLRINPAVAERVLQTAIEVRLPWLDLLQKNSKTWSKQSLLLIAAMTMGRSCKSYRGQQRHPSPYTQGMHLQLRTLKVLSKRYCIDHIVP